MKVWIDKQGREVTIKKAPKCTADCEVCEGMPADCDGDNGYNVYARRPNEAKAVSIKNFNYREQAVSWADTNCERIQ